MSEVRINVGERQSLDSCLCFVMYGCNTIISMQLDECGLGVEAIASTCRN